jgi:hypothetical protein
MDQNDPRIQEKIKALAQMIGQTFAENPDIKQILREMEEEGYHVNIVLTSVAWVSKKDETPNHSLEINAFDRSFLKTFKIRLDDESGPREE